MNLAETEIVFTFWNEAAPKADLQLSMNSPGNLSLLNSPMVLPCQTQIYTYHYIIPD